MNNQYELYAHRGAMWQASENTRAAFNKALQYPIQGMETDIQMSRDEELVLYHDASLERLGLPANKISDYSLKQLKELNFSVGFEEEEFQSIVSLEEYLTSYAGKTHLMLEIKHFDWEEKAWSQKKLERCLELIQGQALDLISIASFHLEYLLFCHKNQPGLSLIYLQDGDYAWGKIQASVATYDFISAYGMPIQRISTAEVDYLKQHQKKILTYTCITEEDLFQAMRAGVDTLICNDLELAVAFFSKL